MARRLWLDCETYNGKCSIKNGTYRYAVDVEVMLLGYAFDDAEPCVADLTADTIPADVRAAFIDPTIQLVAHNVQFDRVMLQTVGLVAPLGRWACSMAQAQSHGLPGSLDKLCELLGVPQDQAKHKDGRELVNLFCKERPKKQKLRRATRGTHPAEWLRFKEYCAADILAMRAVAARLPKWNYSPAGGLEHATWQLDQTINDRGFAVDLDLVSAAVELSAQTSVDLDADVHAATAGDVASARQVAQLLDHVAREYGVYLPDLTADTVERRLNDQDLPEGVRALLQLRTESSKASVSKYQKMINVSVRGRIHGSLQYSGAGRTRRWAGRLVQPQNFPRPKESAARIEHAIAATKCGALPVWGDVNHWLSTSLRGAIVPAGGKRLCVADLANIEGRMQAWLADEDWKLQAFRDYDEGTGADLYKLAFARSFRRDVATVAKPERQIGKVQELSLGYEGGVAAFVSMAAGYRLDLDQLTNAVRDTATPDEWNQSTDFLHWMVAQKRSTYGLSDDVYIACNVVKQAWRDAHPNVAQAWKDLRAAFIRALEWPGQPARAGMLTFCATLNKNWLQVALPSGRFLCYAAPEFDVKTNALTYKGMNQYTRQWCRLNTHGGKLFNNVCQALARDVMADNLLAHIEPSGYATVLTVHDEAITETPDTDEFTGDNLAALLAAPLPWSEGLPLAAAGWHGYRYRKDD